MSNPLLTELKELLNETDLLLACPEPDTDWLDSYGQRRQEIFTRLQNVREHQAQDEAEALRDVLSHVQAQDEVLLQQLEGHRIRCREDLLTLAKARQTVQDRVPSFTGRLLERHI